MTDQQVHAKNGKVLIAGGDPDWPDEYTPEAARAFAADIVVAAMEASRQLAAIAAACHLGHDWDDGTNWGEGEHAYTAWRCRREGCDGYRREDGHQIDDTARIQALVDALPPDDELGRALLDFDQEITVFGRRMTRDERIDMAAMRGTWQGIMRTAWSTVEPTVLGDAFGGKPQPTLAATKIGIPAIQFGPREPS